MSIDHDDKTNAPIITLGDGDVLMGATAAPNIVQLWFAPRPLEDGMDYKAPWPAPAATPPGNEVATVIFLSRESLAGFIEMMTRVQAKAFSS